MRLQSKAFQHDEEIPAIYTCDGDDISPPLSISGIPDGAKSVVLIMDDPDAPAGTWVHWTVWNIPPSVAEIPADSVPAGAMQGVTSSGNAGYGGPCPPSGTHHYFLKAYALDTALDLPASTDAEALETAMEGHILDKAGLIGLYAK